MVCEAVAEGQGPAPSAELTMQSTCLNLGFLMQK